MKSSGLWRDIKANPLILAAVIVFHLVLVVLLSMNLTSSEVPHASGPTKDTVKAVVVDAKKIDDAIKKRKQAEAKKKQQALKKKKKQKEREAKKKKQAEEKKRLAKLKKKKAEAEKKRIAVEKQKKEEETRQLVEEKRKKEEAEEVRLAAIEEQRRQDEQAELRQRLEDEERREIEARRQAQHNKMLDSLRAQYVRLIEQKVERNWLRPVTSTKGMTCEVVVTQTSLGDVMSVKLQQCANDAVFQQSIERAVRKASPLPPPPSPEVFDKEIHFTFRPES